MNVIATDSKGTAEIYVPKTEPLIDQIKRIERIEGAHCHSDHSKYLTVKFKTVKLARAALKQL